MRDVARILPGWLASVTTAHRLTGLQVAIWHDGELACETAVGPADEPAGIPLATTHRLRIASHSKMFTAITVLALVDQGRVRLDDTLGAVVDDLAGTPVADLTLRDLLSHAAGVSRDGADARWWQLERSFADRAALLAMARDGAVVAAPGLHLQYSNIGYGLVGLAIESVTGRTFAEAVRELVLDPLGIDDIGPDLPDGAAGPEDPHGFAAGHSAAVHGARRAVGQPRTGALAPATGFWATAGAIATAAGRVLCDGEILSEDSARTMRRRVWTVTEGRHYGLGLQEGTFHGHAAIGHSGGFPTGLTRTWAVPASRLAVSVLGTAVDAPTSEIAVGILGLIALAAGRPAPQSADAERAGAGGGAGDGAERPGALDAQEGVVFGGAHRSAAEIADAVAGTYDSLQGRMRLAVLGGRLFDLDDTSLDPATGAVELSVDGVLTDPIDTAGEAVALATWGDVGYGSHLEPLVARFDGAECAGIVVTGMELVPSAAFELPDRVRAEF
ncbi:serine hydrolase domain-containing protein [Brachybacterium huguangmaarense]